MNSKDQINSGQKNKISKNVSPLKLKSNSEDPKKDALLLQLACW